MTLRTKITAGINALNTKALDLDNLTDPLDYARGLLWENGILINQADKLWHDRRTLGISASEDLDLNGAALTDAFGGALAFVRIKALLVYASALNTNNVLVGAAAANAWSTWLNPTGVITIRPGGFNYMVAPDAVAHVVTPATGDLLKIANSGAGSTVEYDIIAVGSSA